MSSQAKSYAAYSATTALEPYAFERRTPADTDVAIDRKSVV